MMKRRILVKVLERIESGFAFLYLIKEDECFTLNNWYGSVQFQFGQQAIHVIGLFKYGAKLLLSLKIKNGHLFIRPTAKFSYSPRFTNLASSLHNKWRAIDPVLPPF